MKKKKIMKKKKGPFELDNTVQSSALGIHKIQNNLSRGIKKIDNTLQPSVKYNPYYSYNK